MALVPLRKRGKEDQFWPSVEDFGDFFEGFFPTRWWGRWTPRGELTLDVRESDDDIVVTTEVPGVDAKDIDISVHGDVLSIRGEKKEEKEEKKRNYRRAERWYGSFARSVTLPASVDQAHIKAKCKDGVLTITLPKKEEEKKKSIKVDIE
jgi:HSP20 family protein